MTDAEINLAIAKIEYKELVIDLVGDEVEILTDPNDEIKFVDYCKNWQDIGPIIEREKICVSPVIDEHIHYGPSFTGEWIAEYILGNNLETFKAYAETPTKAAALCYLKMRESE